MSDISFSAMIQKILSESGYKTSSIATDEDGYSHRINFSQEHNTGLIYTENGKITYIDAIGIGLCRLED